MRRTAHEMKSCASSKCFELKQFMGFHIPLEPSSYKEEKKLEQRVEVFLFFIEIVSVGTRWTWVFHIRSEIEL